ncbi:ribosome small subunit-dependent GTPase A [Orrella daihaiensis]
MMSQTVRGRVVSAHGSHFYVELESGQIRHCFPKGRRNEAAVGDWVSVQLQGDQEGQLVAIEPRRNLLYRSDEWRTKQFAANVDQVLLVVAVKPTFADDLLGRALAGAWAADVEPVIVLNKIDIHDGLDQARERLKPYKDLGVTILEVSALDSSTVEQQIRPLLTHKTTLLLGQSAMGKSTLLNALIPAAQANTQEHSVALDAGKHTTTTTKLYHLPESSGDLIDSPGVQAFGLAHLSLEDIERGFPEFARHKEHCRFYNCTHRREPNCGVLDALARGEIDPRRHALYERLLEEKASAKT